MPLLPVKVKKLNHTKQGQHDRMIFFVSASTASKFNKVQINQENPLKKASKRVYFSVQLMPNKIYHIRKNISFSTHNTEAHGPQERIKMFTVIVQPKI